jgi:hypothetical protein
MQSPEPVQESPAPEKSYPPSNQMPPVLRGRPLPPDHSRSGGESPLSDAHQEPLRGSLPAETQKIAQTGEIFELLDHMNRIARLAFQDSPEVAAQFNMNLIQRAARSVRKVEIVEEAPTNEEAGEFEEAV